MVELLAIAAFAGLLICAAGSDAASMTIPNWISVALTLVFLAAALLVGAPLAEIGMHLLFGFAVLALGFFLFQANIVGGGDAKLFAAVGVWTGFTALMPFLFWTVVAGGVLALVLLAARQVMPQTASYPAFVTHLLKKQNGIPYGIAIMAGGLMAIPHLPIVTSPLTLP